MLLHSGDTFGDCIAGTVSARVGLRLEAVEVRLHYVDALALGSAELIDLAAVAIVGVDEVDSRHASTVLSRHVDVVLEAAASDGRLKNGSVVEGFCGPHEQAIVAADFESLAIDFAPGPLFGRQLLRHVVVIKLDGIVDKALSHCRCSDESASKFFHLQMRI